MTQHASPIARTIEALETPLLPGASRLLDDLLDQAVLARPGQDADARAEGLRRAADQVAGLCRLLEAVAPPAVAQPARRRMSA